MRRSSSPKNRKKRITKKSSVAVPSTIKRSGPKARRTFAKVKESARKQYGKGRREIQTAFAQLKKMGYKKKEDRWEKE